MFVGDRAMLGFDDAEPMWRGPFFPRVAFFAQRRICAGEELTWFYGRTHAGSSMLKCRCGTEPCIKEL